jgi:hypothetical protein
VTTNYPRLAAAIAHAASVGGQHADSHINCDLCAAQAEASQAYADELLPDILGGQWIATRHYGWPPFYHANNHSIGSPIYDHEIVFRQRGIRGPNSWQTCAVISQPYNALAVDGEPRPSFEQAAIALTAQHNVGVWVRADLSSWFPGSTSLVVIARGLRRELAQHFGFRSVA